MSSVSVPEETDKPAETYEPNDGDERSGLSPAAIAAIAVAGVAAAAAIVTVIVKSKNKK